MSDDQAEAASVSAGWADDECRDAFLAGWRARAALWNEATTEQWRAAYTDGAPTVIEDLDPPMAAALDSLDEAVRALSRALVALLLTAAATTVLAGVLTLLWVAGHALQP